MIINPAGYSSIAMPTHRTVSIGEARSFPNHKETKQELISAPNMFCSREVSLDECKGLPVRTISKKHDNYAQKREELALQSIRKGEQLQHKQRGKHSRAKSARLKNKIRYAVNSYTWHEFALKKGCAFGETGKYYFVCFGEINKTNGKDIDGIYVWLCEKGPYTSCEGRWEKRLCYNKIPLINSLIEAVKTGELKLQYTKKEWSRVEEAYHENDCQLVSATTEAKGLTSWSQSRDEKRHGIPAKCSLPTQFTPNTVSAVIGNELHQPIFAGQNPLKYECENN